MRKQLGRAPTFSIDAATRKFVLDNESNRGLPGGPGPAGPVGPRGSLWFDGEGPPETISGAVPHDYYLDTLTGDVYELMPEPQAYGESPFGTGPYGGGS